MKLNVRLQGTLIINQDKLTIEVPSPINAGELKTFIKERFSVIGDFMEVTRVAVNEEFISDSDVIKEGDHVALIPPSSGG